LKDEMAECSKKQAYEKAKIIRDQINSMQFLGEKQKVEKDKRYDEDIINYILSNNKVYLLIFNIKHGMLTTKNEFVFDYKEDFMEEFIVQHYADNEVPKEIILPAPLNDESILPYLSGIRKGAVVLTVPQRGEKLDLLELVKRNIEISFFSDSQMISDLRNELKLNSNPNVIECFDISNTQGSLSVGSMVQFRNSRPDKSNYRRFKIKTVAGADDFASIHEVVKRRYYRLKIENAAMPDLIVIDGGEGQLRAALKALSSLELKIPTIALAKQFEEIYTPGTVLKLKRDSKALKLLVQIRNEAHRFAINYHRLLRSKNMLGKN
jgi:excinuclease ABC subunit C